ncbi:MAG: hypothetical protein JWO33_378 [Caulobacteraceae bacterium]|nr:hypothetical protein [Caulobacteraceae bacterium]
MTQGPAAQSDAVRDPRRGSISDRYPAIATELLNPLLDVLGRSREACGGDLDMFVILLAITVRSTEHPDFKRLSQAQLLSGQVPELPSLRTNVHSIASSVGIPRETARRKVAALMAAGWVSRIGRDLTLTAKAYRKLGPVHQGVERLALRYFEVISGCLNEAEPETLSRVADQD